MLVQDLGTMRYRDAWAFQEKIHTEVLNGAEEQLLLVEHSPVITFGRRTEIEGPKHLIASQESLTKLGVELVQSDRGGDITFHGPGQIVAYPIVRLNAHRLSVGGYVRKLEETVIATLKEFDLAARRVDGCVGVWVQEKNETQTRVTGVSPVPDTARTGETPVTHPDSSFILHPSSFPLAKICAIGVRIRRGVSLHGIALNVETDLRYFDLIVPCGLTGKRITSIKKILGDRSPSIPQVKKILSSLFIETFPTEEP